MLKYALLFSVLNLAATCADNPDQTAETLPWAEAVDLIGSGEVTTAVQDHSRLVTLSLRDGSTRTTVEPEIDDLFREIRECGTPCATIGMASE